MDTLYTFWDNSTHYKTESVHFLGLMNSATKIRGLGASGLYGSGFRVFRGFWVFRAQGLGFRI